MFFEAAKIAIESSPIDGELVLVEKQFLRRDGFFILRGDGTAFAGDFRGDPLRELAQRTIVEEERDLGLAQHVNEAGGDDAALGLDFALGMGFAQVADCGEPIAADGDVSRIPGITSAVDDVTVADDEIVVAGRRRGIQVGVVGGCGNFSQGLTGHLLRGLRIRSERDVIYVGSEGEFFSVFGDDVAGEAFAVKHHHAIEPVFGAERAGFREDMAGTGGICLNFSKRAVFAKNRERTKKNLIVRASKVGAEKIGPIPAGAIALSGAGQIELR